jgi:hypothetical protein
MTVAHLMVARQQIGFSGRRQQESMDRKVQSVYHLLP